jgi:hypothetical protein
MAIIILHGLPDFINIGFWNGVISNSHLVIVSCKLIKRGKGNNPVLAELIK